MNIHIYIIHLQYENTIHLQDDYTLHNMNADSPYTSPIKLQFVVNLSLPYTHHIVMQLLNIKCY